MREILAYDLGLIFSLVVLSLKITQIILNVIVAINLLYGLNYHVHLIR